MNNGFNGQYEFLHFVHTLTFISIPAIINIDQYINNIFTLFISQYCGMKINKPIITTNNISSETEKADGITFGNSLLAIFPGYLWPQVWRLGHLAQKTLRIIPELIKQKTEKAKPIIIELLKMITIDINIAIETINKLNMP